MAHALLRWGEIQKARALFDDNLQKTQSAGLMIALIFTIEGVASLYVAQGYPERATQLFAWADAMRDKMGDRRPPVEQNSVEKDLSIIRAKLSNETFTSLYAEGQAMTTEEATALALQEL